jgi:hypothetical protein
MRAAPSRLLDGDLRQSGAAHTLRKATPGGGVGKVTPLTSRPIVARRGVGVHNFNCPLGRRKVRMHFLTRRG